MIYISLAGNVDTSTGDVTHYGYIEDANGQHVSSIKLTTQECCDTVMLHITFRAWSKSIVRECLEDVNDLCTFLKTMDKKMLVGTYPVHAPAKDVHKWIKFTELFGFRYVGILGPEDGSKTHVAVRRL